MQYATKEAASAAIVREEQLFVTRPGQIPLVGTYLSAISGKWRLASTPAFVTMFANFNQPLSWPYHNYSRAFVYLSCCYSAYAPPDRSRMLVEAFRGARAALVIGYDWEVGDPWSRGKDTAFFRALADTCMPGEAKRLLGNLTEPKTRKGKNANWKMVGDTLAMLQPVFQTKINGGLPCPSH